jgi:hypothetical protein
MTWCKYHECTKHSVESLERKPHFLDWPNMPNPFRHYEGVPILDLPADPPFPQTPALEVLRGVCGATPAADGPTFLSELLFYSAAISASKSVPSTGLRYVYGELPNWPECAALWGVDNIAGMRDFAIVLVHLIVTLARLARPGGLRSVVAESVLVRHQLLILNRGRKRAPNLRATDRIIAGLCTLFMRPARVLRSAIVLKPSTLLHLHSVLRKRKYRMLFSPGHRRRPGPKGPNRDLIEAVVAMKRRNPSWGCPRIAQQISLAFGVEIDKDVVRRVLSVHYRPESDSGGPSWLTFLGHTKDSLWSCDLFRCESATLRTHWVLVVMDQFTSRIIGFGLHNGIVDGVALCRMFHRAIGGAQSAQISQLGSRSAVSIPAMGG